jgi:hypothetical protein
VTGQKVLKQAKKVAPLNAEKMEREMKWRQWFPQNIVWKPDAVTPPEVVEPLLEAFRLFCYDNIKIRHPSRGNIALDLRDAQLDTVRGWLTHRYTIVLKARQIGFSTIASAFSLWCVLGWPERQVVMLSKGEREAISLLNKARYSYRKFEPWVVARGPVLLDKTKERMTFDNESMLWSLPSASDPARGESVFLVVVDEWGKFPNQEEAWASIEPITDIGGRVVSLGTASGEGTFYHDMWLGSQSGENDFHGMFFPWWSVPERDENWYERKKRNLLPWQLAQEYPATAEEAFIGSGNPFFDLDLVREMKVEEAEKLDIELKPRTRQPILRESGDLWVWERPKQGTAYVIGADVSQGLTHGDYSVAYVMSAADGNIVAMYRGKPDPEVFGSSVLPALGWWYNYAVMAPEVNNHGLTTVKALQRTGYQRIYRRRTMLKRSESPTETIGWLTTYGNKAFIMDELAAWMREHNVPDHATINELKTFRRDQRGDRVRLHGSPHDDCVMALAITVQARKYAIQNNMLEIKPDLVPGSIAWWAKKLDSDRMEQGKTRLSPVF